MMIHGHPSQVMYRRLRWKSCCSVLLFPWMQKQRRTIQTLFPNNKSIHLLRNVGVVAHIDAGKTTTSEQMLFLSGETKSIGRVDDGDTVMDFLPQERERGITIQSAAISFKWKDHIINLIDTPGHVDFTVEVERSARVLDGAILVIDAVAGVQAQTQTVWRQVRKQRVATVMFVNKMDRDGANYARAVISVKNKLQVHPVQMQLPLGSEQGFYGVIDLSTLTKITWGEPHEVVSSRSPPKPVLTKLKPEDKLFEDAMAARRVMIEQLAEVDESLMEKYLETEENDLLGLDLFPSEDISASTRRHCINGSIVPALCGASLRGKGVELLLNAIVDFLPSPADGLSYSLVHTKTAATQQIDYANKEFCALAFKVVWDTMRGFLVYARIYSGTLDAKDAIYNSSRRIKERVNQLVRVSADDYESISSASAGDVVCLVGLKSTYTGDTIVADKGSWEPYVLDGMTIPEAVYAVSLEPETSSQRLDLEKALAIMEREDPSLRVENNIESGQLLVRGLGELHIEITVDRLQRQYDIPVYIGKAYVAYRESIHTDCGPLAYDFRYDRVIAGKRLFAKVKFQVEPLNSIASVGTASVVRDKTAFTTTQSNRPATSPVIEMHKELAKTMTGDEFTALQDAFQHSLLRGPKGYPVSGVKITVHGLEKDTDTTIGAIRACVAMGVDSVFRNPTLYEFLEPVMSVEINVPTKSIGGVLSDLTVKRRADIIEVVADETSSVSRSTVLAHIPFATMLGYATSIRSSTQGEGSFSMEYLRHAPIDYELASIEMSS